MQVRDSLVPSISSQDRVFSRFRHDDMYIGLFDNHGWSHQPAIILGMDVLENAIITVDHQAGQARIEGVDNRSCTRS